MGRTGLTPPISRRTRGVGEAAEKHARSKARRIVVSNMVTCVSIQQLCEAEIVQCVVWQAGLGILWTQELPNPPFLRDGTTRRAALGGESENANGQVRARPTHDYITTGHSISERSVTRHGCWAHKDALLAVAWSHVGVPKGFHLMSSGPTRRTTRNVWMRKARGVKSAG